MISKKIAMLLMGFLLIGNNLLAKNEPIIINFPDSSIFKGEQYEVAEDSSIIYRGTLSHINFTQEKGFFRVIDSVFSSSTARITNGAGDTMYVHPTDKSDNTSVEFFNEECYIFDLLMNTDYVKRKRYDEKEQEWALYNKSKDSDFQRGRIYAADESYFYDISSGYNYKEDNLMMGIIYFFLILFAFWAIFPLWDFKNNRLAIIVFFTGLISSISSVIFLDTSTLRQLSLPLWGLISTYLLFKLSFYKNKTRIISQFILGIIISGSFGYMQFLKLEDTVRFIDGEEIELNWKRGTGLFKRHMIKKILANMRPVSFLKNDGLYKLYVSKYEFTQGEMEMIDNEIFRGISFLLKKKPLDDFSFRESQIVLEMLEDICGVRFDFLSYTEWMQASSFQNHSPHKFESTKVNRGEENEHGLVNIASNEPEYTSSYYTPSLRLGLSADTILQSYDRVIVAGNAYVSENGRNSSIVYKNIREGSVGFRLVYRPKNVGAKEFRIIGHCRSEKKELGLPQTIELISIDGNNVDQFPNYESFEELLIEKRLQDYRIEAIDISSMDSFSFIQPKGLEFYDFEPIFSLIGINRISFTHNEIP